MSYTLHFYSYWIFTDSALSPVVATSIYLVIFSLPCNIYCKTSNWPLDPTTSLGLLIGQPSFPTLPPLSYKVYFPMGPFDVEYFFFLMHLNNISEGHISALLRGDRQQTDRHCIATYRMKRHRGRTRKFFNKIMFYLKPDFRMLAQTSI